MPGTPPTSPIFGAPRFSDADDATFSAQVNGVTDTFDALAVRADDSRLTDARAPLPGSVTAATIPNASITGSKLAAATVTQSNLAPGSVGTAELIDGGVQNVDLASNSVDARVLAVGGVQGPNIAAGAITTDKLAPASAQALNAPGDLIFSAAAARVGAVLCNGAAYSRTDPTYAALFAALGTTYGAGDGVSTFNVPDYRGRVCVAAGAGAGLTNRALAAKFGEENHVLTTAELASHAHGINAAATGIGLSDPGHNHSFYGRIDHGTGTQASVAFVGWGATPLSATYANYTGITLSDPTHAHAMTNVGGGGGHNTIQPSVAVNVFVKL
jgi:microcystin-dependent protein